jgi:hypothetical protein
MIVWIVERYRTWRQTRRARKNVGRWVRFPTYCQWGMSIHEGKIIDVSEIGYVIREGAFDKHAWFHEVEFIEK